MRAIALVLAVALLLPVAHSSAEPAATPGARVSESLRLLGSAAGVPARDVATAECGSLPAALALLAGDLGVIVPALPPLEREEEEAIARLVCAVHAAELARAEAYAGIDMRALANEIGRESGKPNVELSVEQVAANAAGARAIALAVDDAIALLSSTPRAPVPVPVPAPGTRLPALAAALAPPQYNFPPVMALDLIGQDTLYADDVALIIDVGGNDLYDNNAGGSLIALGNGGLIPVEGDDSSFGRSQCVTPTTNCARVVIGGDFEDAELLFSSALVLDLEGDDRYGVLREPFHDRGCTSDLVVRKVAIQGSGAGGPGLLFDLAGDNVFEAKTIAQGSGHVGGVGVLYLGEGSDTLRAVRFAQGSGLFFGLGLLIDEGGDDRYEARVPTGGVLNTDGGFCDAQARYLHGSGFGRVTGGASGIAGALIEIGGNDIYIGDTKGAGFGEVAGLGLFLDVAGDDTYSAVQRSFGYASGNPSTSGGGLGVFIEAEGNDRYTLTTSAGLGATPAAIVDPTELPEPYTPYTFWLDEIVVRFVNPILLTGAATFYDGEGADTYDTPAARANGQAGPTTIGGLFIDRSS